MAKWTVGLGFIGLAAAGCFNGSPQPGLPCSDEGVCPAGQVCDVSGTCIDLDEADGVLTVALDGRGAGSVTSEPAGIDCGSDCTEAYDAATEITLTAAEATESVFMGWSGGGCEGTGPCTVVIAGDVTVTATFASTAPSVEVSFGGGGTGTVVSDPAGIDCGDACYAEFDADTTVTLTPAPDFGSRFVGWEGACTGAEACSLTVTGPNLVTAVFEPSVQRIVPDSPTRVCYAETAEVACPTDPFEGQDADYVINPASVTVDTEVLHDDVTGLDWELDDTVGVTFAAAKAHCAARATEGYGGRNDWRLPTIWEWTSIIDVGRGASMYYPDLSPGTSNTFYWLDHEQDGTVYSSGTNWGGGYLQPVDNVNVVRCVAGAPYIPSLRASDNVVEDAITGLMWQRGSAGTLNWRDALNYCETSTLDGFDDWRLPTIKELYTIVQPFASPAVFPEFTGTATSVYWSSSPQGLFGAAPATLKIHVSNFSNGTNILNTPTSNAHHLRCVRGPE